MIKLQESQKIKLTSQEQIELEISNFRSKMFNIHDVKLYVVSVPVNPNQNRIISLKELWALLIEVVAENDPEYLEYTFLQKKTRKRTWITYMHAFSHIANKELNFGPTLIGEFLHKNHATAINSINRSEAYIWSNDETFMPGYNLLLNKLKDYVGTIPKNTEI